MTEQNKKYKAGNTKNRQADKASFSRIHIISLFVFTFLLYGNSINHYYALDDNIVLRQNQYVLKGVAGIKDILTHDSFYGFFNEQNGDVAGGRYRPLSLVTFAIEQQLYGRKPVMNHFINVLLYALTAAAIYLLLSRMLLKGGTVYSRMTYLPFISALLFVALPVHTEAVANIKGRDEIMAMLFSIIAANFSLKYFDEGRQIKHLLYCFLFLLVGTLSKENALSFCVIIPVMLWFFRRISVKEFAPLFGLIAVNAIIFIFLRLLMAATSITKEVTDIMNNPFYGMDAGQKFATIFYTFWKYLALLLVPITLTNDYYPFQVSAQNFGSVEAIAGILICLSALVIAFIQLKKRTLISFCIFFAGITLLPASNLVFPVGVFMAERFLFMPSLAFCILLALAVAGVLKTDLGNISWTTTRSFILVTATILLLNSFRTISRNEDWNNNFTLFTADVKNSPNSAKAHYNLASEYMRMGERISSPAESEKYYPLAIAEFRKAILIYPHFAQAYYNLGLTYANLQNNDSAEMEFRKAVFIAPAYKDAVNNIGVCMLNRNKVDSARLIFNGLIRKYPNYSRAYSNMGGCYVKTNQIPKALECYEKALQLDPGNVSLENIIEQVKALQ